MVLVTGATGFIGGRLLPRLTESGLRVRTLLKPSRYTPNLPTGLPLEVAVASLADIRGVRAAMVGVDTIIHLASEEKYGVKADLATCDVEGTENIARSAAEAGAKRLIFVSHLGSDRSSAYPVLKAKGFAEDFVRSSGTPYTILRCGPVYGRGDRFTTAISKAGAALPFIFPLPGQGETLLQPMWVEDLVTSILWLMDDPSTLGQMYEIGGPEFLSVHDVVQMVFRQAGIHRSLFPVRPPYLRWFVVLFERLLPYPPLTGLNLDYVAANRIAELDSLTRMVGLRPARMDDHLGYLNGRRWLLHFISDQMARRERAS